MYTYSYEVGAEDEEMREGGGSESALKMGCGQAVGWLFYFFSFHSLLPMQKRN